MASIADRPLRREGGFTLIEVLVAMAILGLAVLALLRLGTAHAQTAIQLEGAALGDIVAENALIDAQTQAAPPAYGTDRIAVTNAGQRFSLVLTAERAAVEGVMLIRVEAFDSEGMRVAMVEGMRGTGA